MRFLIFSTEYGSIPDRYKETTIPKPVNNAFSELLIYTRHHTPSGFWPEDSPSIKEWQSRGENHRVKNGYLVRDEEVPVWFVDIDSLEQLRELRRNVDEEIICGFTQSEKLHKRDGSEYEYDGTLEIYNDYRE